METVQSILSSGDRRRRFYRSSLNLRTAPTRRLTRVLNHDQKTIEVLEALPPMSWSGTVFRHMFGQYSPDRENRSGARWNPPETPAIYTSLQRETALAEADYSISLQPLRPQAQRWLYTITVALSSVLDLSKWESLSRIGLSRESLLSFDYSSCQRIGGAVEWLKHDGLLVPSARAEGVNLVIFPRQQTQDYRFEVLDCQEVRSAG